MADLWASHYTDRGLRASGGAARWQGWRRQERVGGHLWGAATGGSEAPSGLDKGTKDEGGLDGTNGDDGEKRGGSLNSSSVSQSIRSPSMSSSPRCIIRSLSAMVQGAELHSMLTPSMAGSLVVGTIAGSHTWSDGLGSISGVIFRSVAQLCASSLIAVGNGSPSSVGLGWCSAPQRVGGLSSESGVDLVRSSTRQMVSGDPLLGRVHSMKAENYAQGQTAALCMRHSG